MKRIFTFLALLLVFQGAFSLFAADSVTQPEAGEYYTIKHASGLFLTKNPEADNPKIMNPSGYPYQVFSFEPVAGEDATYYIRNIEGSYLVRGDANAWSMFWVSDPTTITTPANGKYQIVAITGTTTYIQLKNLGSGSMLGVDNTASNSSVYANKSGATEPKYQWSIAVFTDDVNKDGLIALHAEAVDLFDATTVGTGSDQYPQATRNTLQSAISTAKDAIDNMAADQNEVNDATQILTEALDAYRKSVYPFQPDVTATYYIKHSSGLFINNHIVLANSTYDADQYFQFVAVEGKTAVYNITQPATDTYLTRSSTSAWVLSWESDATSDFAQFQIKSNGKGYYWIKCMDTANADEKSHLGTDANTAGSGIFIDKNGADGKHLWQVINVSDLGVVKTQLEAALAKVNEFMTYAVSGDGSDQYPEAQYSLLAAALTDAQVVMDNPSAVQTEVNSVTTALETALSECIAAVNPFVADVTATYNIVHFRGFYLGEYSKEETENIIAVFTKVEGEGSDSQTFKFIESTSPGVYNISVVSLPYLYLTRVSDPAADDYKLSWADNPITEFAQFEIKKSGNKDYYKIKCLAAGPTRANSHVGTDNNPVDFGGVYVDKAGTADDHLWKIVNTAGTSSVDKTTQSGVIAYAVGGSLNISNLDGANKVSVYTTTGQLVSTSTVSGSSYAKALNSGIYIVTVAGQTPYKGIVIVK